jgi:hypothetical protein
MDNSMRDKQLRAPRYIRNARKVCHSWLRVERLQPLWFLQVEETQETKEGGAVR